MKNNNEGFINNSKLNADKILNRHRKLYKHNFYLQKEVDELIEKVSKNNNIQKKEVKFIILSQFKALKNTLVNCSPSKKEDINYEDAKIIRIMNFGVFRPTNDKIKQRKK